MRSLGLSTERFKVVREMTFVAGHRVPSHAGKCRSPHGHMYRVVLAVAGELQEEGSSEGMVLDFGDIKKVLQEIHDKFDHGFVYYNRDEMMKHLVIVSKDFEDDIKWIEVNFVPTAENFSKWCFQYAQDRFEDLNLSGEVVLCEVFESLETSALYPG